MADEGPLPVPPDSLNVKWGDVGAAMPGKASTEEVLLQLDVSMSAENLLDYYVRQLDALFEGWSDDHLLHIHASRVDSELLHVQLSLQKTAKKEEYFDFRTGTFVDASAQSVQVRDLRRPSSLPESRNRAQSSPLDTNHNSHSQTTNDLVRARSMSGAAMAANITPSPPPLSPTPPQPGSGARRRSVSLVIQCPKTTSEGGESDGSRSSSSQSFNRSNANSTEPLTPVPPPAASPKIPSGRPQKSPHRLKFRQSSSGELGS